LQKWLISSVVGLFDIVNRGNQEASVVGDGSLVPWPADAPLEALEVEETQRAADGDEHEHTERRRGDEEGNVEEQGDGGDAEEEAQTDLEVGVPSLEVVLEAGSQGEVLDGQGHDGERVEVRRHSRRDEHASEHGAVEREGLPPPGRGRTGMGIVKEEHVQEEKYGRQGPDGVVTEGDRQGAEDRRYAIDDEKEEDGEEGWGEGRSYEGRWRGVADDSKSKADNGNDGHQQHEGVEREGVAEGMEEEGDEDEDRGEVLGDGQAAADELGQTVRPDILIRSDGLQKSFVNLIVLAQAFLV